MTVDRPHAFGDRCVVEPRPALPFRMLRRGLQAASKAGASVMERVLRPEDVPAPPVVVARRPGEPVVLRSPVPLTVDGQTVQVEKGATVLEAARLHGLDLRYYCGGNCSCGTCRVQVVRGPEGLSRPRDNETFTLGMEAARRGDRLACQARVMGPVELKIPPW